MNFRTFLLASLIFLSASPTFAQTFSTPVQVSTDPGAHSPAMHVGRDGTIFVSWFENNADIYFSRSTDGGATFTPSVQVSQQVTINQWTSLLQRAPNFAIDTNGVIHLVWMEARIPNPKTGGEQSDIWYSRSSDNGATWTKPFSIMDADDSNLYAQDFPAIAIDSSNNLYVCYLDNRYLMRRIASHYKMQLERSTDGGATWSKPVIADKLPFADAGTCECCRDDIAVSPQGHVYIAFRTSMTEPIGDERDIFICRSIDGGLTFDSSIQCQLGDWTLMACPTKGPQIALDKNENLHIAWSDARDDSGKLVSYYTLLRKGDTSVFPNYSVSYGTPNATWPAVAVAPDGEIAYSYVLDYSGGPNRFTYSSNGGNTWHRTLGLPGTSGDAQTIPCLAFDGDGNLHTAWQDVSANGILVSKVTNLQPQQSTDSIIVNNKSTYLPNRPITLSWTRPLAMKGSDFVWYHFLLNGGGTMLNYTVRDTSIRFDSLAEGQYTISIASYTTAGLLDSVSNTFVVTPPATVVPSNEPSIEAYPNPVTNGMLIITGMQENNIEQVVILDGKGSIISKLSVMPEAGVLNISVRGLRSGVYTCELIGKADRRIRFVIP